MNARSWVVAALLLATTPLMAESMSKSMSVSTEVVASVRLTVESEPATVQVTAEDLRRGYVDLPEPIVIRVQTNSREGYLLQVANADDAFRSLELSFDDTAMSVAHESFLQRPYVRGGDSIAMRARLHLSPQTPAGLHRLPVAVSAAPL